MKSVTEKVLCQKIDKYYFKNAKGRICKYSQFCMQKGCKTESSYNFENIKRTRYCYKHKKENMVNIKRGHKLCQKCKSSYKKNVLLQNVNMQLKNTNLLQNI